MELHDWTISRVDVIPVRNARGREFCMRNRSRHAIIIVPEGAYVYRQGALTLPSDPEHVIYLPKGSDYTLKCLHDDLSYVVNFEGETGETRLRCFPVTNGEELTRQVRRMAEHSDRLFLLSALYGLLDLVDTSGRNAQLSCRTIRKGVAYLQQHFAQPDVTPGLAAQCAGISEAYFRKAFGAAYGIPPMKYVQQLRMEQARRMLCERACSVEQVAAACGYASVYSFSSSFRRATGYSPTGYIQAYSRL